MSFASSFPGFRLRITRWGLVYLVTSVIIGLAAVNTGNNALMAVLGLALGSYVVSGIWSRQVLGNIEATIELPPEIFAGRPAVIGVELENTSRFLPAYGLVARVGGGTRSSWFFPIAAATSSAPGVLTCSFPSGSSSSRRY